jgi:hypothetical protein
LLRHVPVARGPVRSNRRLSCLGRGRRAFSSMPRAKFVIRRLRGRTIAPIISSLHRTRDLGKLNGIDPQVYVGRHPHAHRPSSTISTSSCPGWAAQPLLTREGRGTKLTARRRTQPTLYCRRRGAHASGRVKTAQGAAMPRSTCFAQRHQHRGGLGGDRARDQHWPAEQPAQPLQPADQIDRGANGGEVQPIGSAGNSSARRSASRWAMPARPGPGPAQDSPAPGRSCPPAPGPVRPASRAPLGWAGRWQSPAPSRARAGDQSRLGGAAFPRGRRRRALLAEATPPEAHRGGRVQGCLMREPAGDRA